MSEFPVGNQIIEFLIFSLKSQRSISFTEFVKWVLPFCSNIDTLKIRLIEQPNDLHNEIVRLKKLKDFHIGAQCKIDLKEVKSVVFRSKITLLTSS